MEFKLLIVLFFLSPLIQGCYYEGRCCYCCPEFFYNNCNNCNLKDYLLFEQTEMDQIKNLYFVNNSLSTGPTLDYIKLFPNLELIDLRNNSICKPFTKLEGVEYLLTPCSKYS